MSGNGLVVETTPSFGPNASERFDRDVLSLPNVTHLIILIGINDIGHPSSAGQPPTPAAVIISNLQQLAARARSHGIKVYASPLPPFEGTIFGSYYSPAGEAVRQSVNAWIRSTKALDGVVDFDKALADPQNPKRLLPAFDSGDHLHPNDAGYAAMADAINLEQFR